ncbi:MAG: MFS transporter, partial [Actinomycetota bacterium]
RWFHARREVALSISSSGLAVVGILISPIAMGLLDNRGRSAGTQWLGLLYVIGVVPVTLILVRPDPEALGWAPDGIRRAVGESAPPLTGTPFAEAVRSRFFIAVTVGYIFALGSQVGGIQQLVKLVEDRTTPETAQFAITVLAAMSVIARLIGGRVVQLVPMMGFTVALAVMQCVALALLAIAESRWMIFVAIVIFGATVGNILMLQPLLIAERFGVRDYPRLFSRSQFVAVVGTAGGPLLIGWLFDVAGSYRIPYLAAAGCALLGALILARGGPATVPDDEQQG